jgi:hypothetical protein
MHSRYKTDVVAARSTALAIGPGDAARSFLSQLALWPARRWLVAVVAALAAGLLIGLPTDVVPNPFYRRMTPVVWWDYPIWALSAVLFGLVAATYVRIGPGDGRGPSVKTARVEGGGAFGGGVLAFLAVGCPICNKLVVALLGVGGALSYFGPAQPLLGVLGVALLATTLVVRLRGVAACTAQVR